MNPERILEAVYEDAPDRAMTLSEKMEIVNFLSYLLRRLIDEPTESRMIH